MPSTTVWDQGVPAGALGSLRSGVCLCCLCWGSTHRCAESRGSIVPRSHEPRQRGTCATSVPTTRGQHQSATAEALERPRPVDFPASGRTGSLKDLRLNERVCVKYREHGHRPDKLYGTLGCEVIHLWTKTVANQLPLNPTAFVTMAKHDVSWEHEAYALIYSESGRSLLEVLKNGKSRKWNAQAIATCLDSQYGVRTMQDLQGFFQVFHCLLPVSCYASCASPATCWPVFSFVLGPVFLI